MKVNAFDLAANVEWAIEPCAFAQLLSVADRMGDPEALQAKLGRKLDNARTVSVRDGVAIIPVTGPIFRRASLFTEISGATSTDILALDLRAALDDPMVKGIVLDIDSPGGTVAGTNELAGMVRDARGKKPIVAYANGTMASAAYWIASAADSIVVDATSPVGCIGVVAAIAEKSDKDPRTGVRTHEIVSSRAPNKRLDINSEGGRAEVQRNVDAIEDVFVQTVAANRGVSVEKVTNDFGRGGVLIGAAAVAAGMADRLGSLESVIAEIANPKAKPTGAKHMSTAPKGAITVKNTDEMRAALAAGHTADEITVQAPAAEPSAEALNAARTEATTAERTRVGEVLALSGVQIEPSIAKAIKEGTSAGAAAQAIVAEAKSKGVSLGALKRDSTRAEHQAAADDDGKVVRIDAQSIFAKRAAAAAK
jgi:capsid assembly protease